MNLLDFIFRRNGSSSSETAKNRLKLVLIQDRSSLPASLLDTLRDELLRVISKHVKVDKGDIEVSISRAQNYNTLVVNVPFRAPKRQLRKLATVTE
ncbi:MAG: cell division topological specificity factor MinE [Acidobacteria bacterium]|nr:cell division topological specificity factor MinE [Acidobacteriota bacterium]